MQAEHLTPNQSLKRLLDGNKRYLERGGHMQRDFTSRREQIAEHQDPYAVILGCGDSRVPPSILFDTGLGDIFEVRVAGIVLGDSVLASIEYGALKAGGEVVVVLGHERCGAVMAALMPKEKREKLPGKIAWLVEKIASLIPRIQGMSGDPAENLMRENVRHVISEIRRKSPALAEAEKSGRIRIVGARYDMDDGRVTLLE
jgi:carbonic anhydrase